ncbi:hypothetical protein OXX79_012957, partial [Metschnikowia pulcherrima]
MLPKKSDRQAETDALRVKEFFGTLTELELELLKKRQPESGSALPSHSTGSAVGVSDSTSPVVDVCSTLEIQTEASGQACKASAQTDVTPNKQLTSSLTPVGNDSTSEMQSVVPGKSLNDSSQTDGPETTAAVSNKRKTRSQRVVDFKKKKLDGKKLVLISQGRNDTSVRKPMNTVTVASLNVLTGSPDFVNCTTDVDPDIFIGDMKSKLHSSSGNVSKEAEAEDDEARLAVSRSVRVAAEIFVLQRSSFEDLVPESYMDAVKSPNRSNWIKAIDEEMDALNANGTFTLVPLQQSMRPINCRWVFARKDGGRFKARLVAKGFTQIPGVDYGETYSPVIKHTSLRLLIAVAAKFGMEMHHCDFTTAFLNGELKEEIYMRQPPGRGQTLDGSDRTGNFVYKLNKSLYGLKQAPQVWNETINKVLVTLEFKQSVNEPCLYSRNTSQGLVLLGMYVDDLLVVSCNKQAIAETKKALGDAFKMKDLGPVKKFLGINFDVNSTHIKIHLGDYVKSMLNSYGFDKIGSVTVPASQVNLE